MAAKFVECPGCGTKMGVLATYCPNCGEKLPESEHCVHPDEQFAYDQELCNNIMHKVAGHYYGHIHCVVCGKIL